MPLTEREQAIDAMTEAGVPYDIASIVRHNAATYARIQERWACEEMSDKTTAALEAKEQRIEQRITSLLKPYGITVTFGGDPRGYTVKLSLPSGKYNSWGGKESGFGIA